MGKKGIIIVIVLLLIVFVVVLLVLKPSEPLEEDREELAWDEALVVLYNGDVQTVGWINDREVTLFLKEGKRVYVQEPYTNAIFEEIKKCGEKCKDIVVGKG